MNRRAAKTTVAAAALAASLAATPARSEPLYMFWQLVPVSTQPSPIAFHQTFSTQRLVPIAAVRLQDRVVVEHPRNPPERETIAAGILLQLVTSEDGKIGYCPVPQPRPTNPRGTLVNRRTCLIDRDGDGRFEASFNIEYGRTGGLPAVHGSMNRTRPLAATAGYVTGDPRDYPLPITFSLTFRGNANDVSVDMNFSDPLLGEFHRRPGYRQGDVTVINAGTSTIRVHNVVDRMVTFDLTHHDLVLSNDHRNRMVTGDIPPHVRAVIGR